MIRTRPGRLAPAWIGYVIEPVGLFPHRTIAQNIATVPRLLRLGAGESRPRRRLLELVGLDPTFSPLSGRAVGVGGQPVGLTLALAADPPCC